MNGSYIQDLIRVVAEIRRRGGESDGESFLSEKHILRTDFIPIEPAGDRPITAIDGSNATVYSTPFFNLIACRGAMPAYENQERHSLKLTSWRIFRIGEGQDEDYAELYSEYFGRIPDASLEKGNTLAAEAAFRDTIEYGLAAIAARTSEPGTLLLLDGALYAEHPSHTAILAEIQQTCRERGLLLAAVTKNAGATWDGVHPIVPSAMRAAGELGIRPPWYLKVEEGYVACLHPRAKRAFLVTVPDDYSEQEVAAVFSALASYAGDGRVVGYPYPLMDAHRQAVIRSDQVQRIRHDIIAGCSTQSINSVGYEEILGDYHDELNRY
ncbi:DNA double-strand break repair nuclease NurA [Methanocalculus taiwanensis]|uniref:DNA double-strand break repair nuclease NurA n=1 Tax=Methanocalculus taiwanensis TaxID=106207 RepID=A0ABD4TK73_9EURY|nr:DNA double-strand break repair nuclease NurA [Methanocalculus taiwanensis]MCQ1538154.1 DNA double-strand break repair nuclease NurA [Methanocalculus taiwanensis]